MIVCFRDAKIKRVICAIIGVVAAVILYFTVWAQSDWPNNLVYPLVVAFAGCAIGQMVAGTTAKNKHRDLLNILYKNMDPEGFIEAYEPLLNNCKKDSIQYIVVSSYLANGYATKGDFGRAEEILEALDTSSLKKRKLSARGMICNNLANAYLFDGNTEAAERVLNDMHAIITTAKAQSPQLGAGLEYNIQRYEGHLLYLKGEPVENLDYFKDEYRMAVNPVQKGNVGLLLAWFYLAEAKRTQENADSETAEAKKILEEIAASGEQLYSTKTARALLEEIG